MAASCSYEVLNWHKDVALSPSNKAFLERLGVSDSPRIDKAEGSDSFVLSPPLEALRKLASDEPDFLVPTLTLLFQSWAYYSRSAELLMALNQIGAPTQLGSRKCPWHYVWAIKSGKDDALMDVLPVLSLDMDQFDKKEMILRDLKVKTFPNLRENSLAVQEWLTDCERLDVWASFYGHLQKAGIPRPHLVFAGERKMVSLHECCWDGWECVSKWTTVTPVQLSSLYPKELKSFFVPPVAPSQGPKSMISALSHIWRDQETDDFRKITPELVAEAGEIYKLLSQADLTLLPAGGIPILRSTRNVRDDPLFVFQSQKVIHNDCEKIRAAVYLPKFCEHAVLSSLPNLLDALHVPRMSQLAVSWPTRVNAVTPSPSLFYSEPDSNFCGKLASCSRSRLSAIRLSF